MMVIYLVLLSTRTRSWKITDFGLTSEGISRRAYTTRHGRGTDCYRAPELIAHATVSMKSDIWALGCIMFELIAGRKLFEHDFQVFQFVSNQRKLDDPVIPEEADRRFRGVINALLRSILVRDWWKRPSALEILKCFQIFSNEKASVHYITAESPFFLRIEATVILGSDSICWGKVQWMRYWYCHKLNMNLWS
jgi:serine/threonine protein kinase